MKSFIFVLLTLLWCHTPAYADNHFGSSNELGPDVIKITDPSVGYTSMPTEGIQEYTLLDRRVGDDPVPTDVYEIEILYDDGTRVTFLVNSEYGSLSAALADVDIYAFAIGQIPFVLRYGVGRITLHKGDELWTTGCSSGMNLYTDDTLHMRDVRGTLEETLFHEAVHASIDCLYRYSDHWLAAQEADVSFISGFAEAYPVREDLAETAFACYAASARRGRISQDDANLVLSLIPNRCDFLVQALGPLPGADFELNAGLNGSWFEPETSGQGFFIDVFPDSGQIFLGWYTYDASLPSGNEGSTIGDAGHRWLTALGTYEGSVAIMTLYNTAGGMFDSEDPPPVTDMEGYGTLVLEFEGCESFSAHYDIPSSGMSGSIPLQRIVNDNVSLCEQLSTSND